MKNPIGVIDLAAKRAFKVLPFVSSLAPAVVIVFGVSVVFAIVQSHRALSAGAQAAGTILQQTVKPRLEMIPMDEQGYTAAVDMLSRLNPNVAIGLRKDIGALRVVAQDPAQLPEWLYALSTVQSYRKGLVWSASEICLKKCEGNVAASADLKAFTQKISVQSTTK